MILSLYCYNFLHNSDIKYNNVETLHNGSRIQATMERNVCKSLSSDEIILCWSQTLFLLIRTMFFRLGSCDNTSVMGNCAHENFQSIQFPKFLTLELTNLSTSELQNSLKLHKPKFVNYISRSPNFWTWKFKISINPGCTHRCPRALRRAQLPITMIDTLP